jgi:Uma2 family endonuclease
MSAIPKTKLTAKDYLEFERNSDIKHEYFDGEIFEMSGAKRNHNKITTNLSGLVWQHLKGKNCENYSNDMRVFVPETGLYTYPDLVVVCGEPQFQDDVFDTLLNPVLLVEVLSDSTESYDRGKKFQHYRSIESLQEYILVSQNEARNQTSPRSSRAQATLTQSSASRRGKSSPGGMTPTIRWGTPSRSRSRPITPGSPP